MYVVRAKNVDAGHHPLAEPREAALRVLPAVDERRVAPPGRSNTADDAV